MLRLTEIMDMNGVLSLGFISRYVLSILYIVLFYISEKYVSGKKYPYMQNEGLYTYCCNSLYFC